MIPTLQTRRQRPGELGRQSPERCITPPSTALVPLFLTVTRVFREQPLRPGVHFLLCVCAPLHRQRGACSLGEWSSLSCGVFS